MFISDKTCIIQGCTCKDFRNVRSRRCVMHDSICITGHKVGNREVTLKPAKEAKDFYEYHCSGQQQTLNFIKLHPMANALWRCQPWVN